MEGGLRSIDETAATEVRQKITGLLTKARPPPKNLTYKESRALKELKNDHDLVVLPADKGNAAVIMDTLKYEDKMTNFLSDESTYRLLEKDPTPSLQCKMNATLLQLKKDRKIPTTKYNTLRCSSGRIPSIYGLPKIHKPDIPLRPIVSFYSSPTYELSKFLVICLFEVQIVSHAPWMEACHHVSHQRIMRFRI